MAFDSFRALVEKLAVLAVGLSPDKAMAISDSLAVVPEPVLESALDGEPAGLAEREQRLLVLQLMRLDPRPGLRRAVADTCGGCADAPWEAAPLLAELAQDAEPEVRGAAARAMASLLQHAAPADRTALLDTWASHPQPGVRLALVQALACAPETVGLRTALDLLAEDPVREIRSAVATLAMRARPVGQA